MLVVSSPQVAEPVAVRYAWADDPVCNLINQAGLPASPFRSDQPPYQKLLATMRGDAGVPAITRT
jgi:sialate O-acetylesterase